MGKCHNSLVVKRPIADVWSAIRDFHDFSWAPSLITSCVAVGEAKGDQLGAKRILNGAFHETLLGLDDMRYTMTYSIDDGPGPVANDSISNYVGLVQLFRITNDDSTLVQWISSYESANSAAVGELCNPIYKAALDALKASCEA